MQWEILWYTVVIPLCLGTVIIVLQGIYHATHYLLKQFSLINRVIWTGVMETLGYIERDIMMVTNACKVYV